MNDNVIGARACGRVHGRAMLLAQQPAPGHASINASRQSAQRLRRAAPQSCSADPFSRCGAMAGTDNKYETHVFCPERPRGKLHRAFSVFLFNAEGKLLLQQVGLLVRAWQPRAGVPPCSAPGSSVSGGADAAGHALRGVTSTAWIRCGCPVSYQQRALCMGGVVAREALKTL
jgi:hypothetical protein